MDVQLWLSQVRRCCRQQHLPAFYIDRLVSELADHHIDFMEDTMRMDANVSQMTTALGSPSDLAVQAAQEYRQSRFCGRHPILAFVVLPIVALPLLWTGALALTLFIGHLIGLESGSTPDPKYQQWAEWSLPGVLLTSVLVPIAMAGSLCCYLARRSAVGWKWILAATLIVATVGSSAVFNIGLPTADHKGTLMVGLGVTTHPSWAQIMQFLLPLCIGVWTIWRQSEPRRGGMATT